MTIRRVLPSLLLSITAGCTTVSGGIPPTGHYDPHGQVSFRPVPSDAAATYQMSAQQHSFGAQPVVHAPPSYPADLLDAGLPSTVISAKVIVDEKGNVTDVRDLHNDSSIGHARFLDAVRQAALRWSYTPMTVVQDHEDEAGNLTSTRSDMPFSLDYDFRFELKDGVPSVSSPRAVTQGQSR